ILHLLAELSHVPAVLESREKCVPLWHLLFRQFRGDLLLLAFAQNRQGHGCSILKSLQEFPQLIWIDQDLVVQHFQNIVLLKTSRGRRTVGYHIIDNETESFGQAELFAHHGRNLRSFDPQENERDFWAT